MNDQRLDTNSPDAARALVAADVMTSPALACRATAFFEEAAEVLAVHRISGVPVVDEAGAVVGVLSERDLAHSLGGPLVRLALRRGLHRDQAVDAAELPRDARRVRDIMTSPAVVVPADMPLREVAYLMSRDEVTRVPVVAGDALIGVVTRGDVLAGLSGHAPARLDAPVLPPVTFGTAATGRPEPFTVAAGGPR